MAFLGWEITTDADAFDPTVATFMDFRGRHPGTASFCYVLPTTARRALVEIAAFQWIRDGLDRARALTDYLLMIELGIFGRGTARARMRLHAIFVGVFLVASHIAMLFGMLDPALLGWTPTHTMPTGDTMPSMGM